MSFAECFPLGPGSSLGSYFAFSCNISSSSFSLEHFCYDMVFFKSIAPPHPFFFKFPYWGLTGVSS